jgi:tRNA modification GTPase trmE
MNDTICAISTALGVGAISIIRVSGDEAIDIVNKIFDKDLTKKESHTINYGHIVYNGEIIDEVMVSIMKSPKTFTKEDIVEINSHGGVAVTNKVLEILLLEGARLAEPGEFTKRAFLNGRIDLVEAESIMDLIESKTETSRKLAISGMEGKVSKLVKNIIDNLVKINANIEVNIDYPEYEDIEIVTKEKIEEMSKYINKELTKLLNESENGKLIKDGINTLILGRPNVGKSSILNKLIEEDKAIVTSVAGTTRDIVEGQIRVNGILLNIIDTAGVRETEDIVEKIGVEKSLSLVNDADLIILVFNNNEKLTDEDKKLLEYTKEKKRIIVINKIDLENNLDISNLKNERIVKISALKDSGIESLKNEINDMFNLEEINLGDFTYLSNSRQISLVKKAVEISKNLEDALNNDVPIDLLEIDIKEICEILGEIIGESYDDKLIDTLFSNFCLGK